MEDGLGAASSMILVNNVVSQSVPHLHLHVIPRNPKDGLRFWLGPGRSTTPSTRPGSTPPRSAPRSPASASAGSPPPAAPPRPRGILSRRRAPCMNASGVWTMLLQVGCGEAGCAPPGHCGVPGRGPHGQPGQVLARGERGQLLGVGHA